MVQVSNLKKLCGVGARDVTDDEITDYVMAYKSNEIGDTYNRNKISLPLMNAGLKNLQSDGNVNPSEATANSIAKLKNEIEMVEQVCNSGLNAVSDVNDAYNALGKDVKDFNDIVSKQKQHISELRGNFELTRGEKQKEITINVYYSKLYDAYLNILKVIAFFSFLLVVLALLNSYGIISGNIQLYLSLTIIIICSVIVIRKIVDIYSRSPHNFDEYKWMDDTSNKTFDGKNPRAPGNKRNKLGLSLRGRCPPVTVDNASTENIDINNSGDVIETFVENNVGDTTTSESELKFPFLLPPSKKGSYDYQQNINDVGSSSAADIIAASTQRNITDSEIAVVISDTLRKTGKLELTGKERPEFINFMNSKAVQQGLSDVELADVIAYLRIGNLSDSKIISLISDPSLTMMFAIVSESFGRSRNIPALSDSELAAAYSLYANNMGVEVPNAQITAIIPQIRRALSL